MEDFYGLLQLFQGLLSWLSWQWGIDSSLKKGWLNWELVMTCYMCSVELVLKIEIISFLKCFFAQRIWRNIISLCCQESIITWAVKHWKVKSLSTHSCRLGSSASVNHIWYHKNATLLLGTISIKEQIVGIIRKQVKYLIEKANSFSLFQC